MNEKLTVEGYHQQQNHEPDWHRAIEQAMETGWWAMQMPDGSIWERFVTPDGKTWGMWLAVPNRTSWERFLKERDGAG